MKKSIIKLLGFTFVALMLFSPYSAAFALTPLPQVDIYYDFFAKDDISPAVLETVVIPQNLQGQKVGGIKINLSDQRYQLPTPTGVSVKVANKSTDTVTDWQEDSWQCDYETSAISCTGNSDLPVGKALHIAIFFDEVTPPQYLPVDVLNEKQEKIFNTGVTGRAEFKKINPYCPVPKTSKPLEIKTEFKQEIPAPAAEAVTNLSEAGKENFTGLTDDFSPIKAAIPAGVALLGAGLAFGLRKRFPVLKSGALVGLAISVSAIPLFYDLIQKLDRGEPIGPFWCPDQCQIAQCQNFQITKIVFVKAGEDPETAGNDVAEMIDMIGYFKWLPNPAVPSNIVDPVAIADWLLKRKINKANAQAFQEALKKFNENQVLSEQLLFGVDLYVYYDREKCGLSDCLFGVAYRYNWKKSSFGPIKIFPPKEAEQPYVSGLQGGMPKTWRLGYLIDANNEQAFANYITGAFKEAMAPRYCEP